MKSALSERAVYRSPSFDPAQRDDEAAWKGYEEKVAAGPNALIVYAPGAGVMPGRRAMGIERASSVLGCRVAALVVARLAPGAGYFSRTIVAAAFGLFSAPSIEASYWNGYGFPTE
jgi:hypothetical protein